MIPGNFPKKETFLKNVTNAKNMKETGFEPAHITISQLECDALDRLATLPTFYTPPRTQEIFIISINMIFRVWVFVNITTTILLSDQHSDEYSLFE